MAPGRAAGLLIMEKLSVQFWQWTTVFWNCSIWDSCCGPLACSSVWEKLPLTFLNCKWPHFKRPVWLSWGTGKLVHNTWGQLLKYNKVNTRSKIWAQNRTLNKFEDSILWWCYQHHPTFKARIKRLESYQIWYFFFSLPVSIPTLPTGYSS